MLARQCQSPQDEVEALNADVMRFMAILGLCLMLIFAAMEGVRVSSMDTSNENREKVEALNNQLSQKIKILEQEKQQNQKKSQAIVDNAEQRVQQLEQSNQMKQQENTQLKQMLQALKNKQKIEKNTAEMNEQLRQQKYLAEKKQTEILLAQALTQVTQLKNEQLKKRIMKKQPQSKQKGYMLRFSNDEALVQLVKQQQIQLIITQQGSPFRVRHNSTISKQALQGKHQMYTLNNHTVPRIYQQAFNSTATDRWGVILPPHITQSLQGMMQQHANGVLEINAQGRVSLQ